MTINQPPPTDPEPLHADCVLCQAHTTSANAMEQTYWLLLTLAEGYLFEDLYDGLCFLHRRHFDDACREAWGANS